MLPVTSFQGQHRRRDWHPKYVHRKKRSNSALAAGLLLVLGIGWVLYLYNGITSSEEKADLHLHVVDEGSEAGIRQRLTMLEKKVHDLDLARGALEHHDEGDEGGAAGSGGGHKNADVVALGRGRQPADAEPQRFLHQRIVDGDNLGLLGGKRSPLGDDSNLGNGHVLGGDGVEANLHRIRLNLLAEQRKKRHVKDIPLEPRLPLEPAPVMSDEEVAGLRRQVELATLHAWQGYEDYAWGWDELRPLSKNGANNFGGLGATIVDSLDTLKMMGLNKEYQRGVEWMRDDFSPMKNFSASVFETTIRVIGGCLAAYEMTGDAILLKRSLDTVDRLMAAYNSPTGIPHGTINLLTQEFPKRRAHVAALSEFGTQQLEFYKLSELTGDPRYRDLARHSIEYLHDRFPDKGLLPLELNLQSGRVLSHRASMGGLGDSYYEYLLKTWLLTGKREELYRSMWEKAMDEMLDKMVLNSTEGHLYIAELDTLSKKQLPRHRMDHLACFVPGMLALGANASAVAPDKAARYMAVAAELAETCWHAYARQKTGLGPEIVAFRSKGVMTDHSPAFLQRPEAVESWWYLWRFTGDWRYRSWGKAMLEGMQKHCKREVGYVSLKDVREEQPEPLDVQNSFLIAETFKYLWLLFSDDSAFNFETTVLNTEAHPLKIITAENVVGAV